MSETFQYRYKGMKNEDYLVMNALLKKNRYIDQLSFRKLLRCRHEGNQEEHFLLLIYEVERAGQKYILKVKRRMLENDEYKLQCKAYAACPNSVIKPIFGGHFDHTIDGESISCTYILMEEGQPATVLITRKKKEVLRLFQELLHNLDIILRKAHISHRDIKLDNLVYQDGHLKLIDFDFASTNINTHTQTKVSSGFYTAPEVFSGHYSANKSMAFSIAVCICVILNQGNLPGNISKSQYDQMYEVQRNEFNMLRKSKKFSMPLKDSSDTRLMSILKKAIAWDPAHRSGLKSFEKNVEDYLCKKLVPTRPVSSPLSTILIILITLMIGIASIGGVIYYGTTYESGASEITYKYILGDPVDSEHGTVEAGPEKKLSDGTRQITCTIHPAAQDSHELTYQLPASQFTAKGDNLEIGQTFRLNAMGIPLDEIEEDGGISAKLIPASDNISNVDYHIDFANESLKLLKLSVKDNQPVCFQLQILYEKQVLYQTNIEIIFMYK